MKMSAKTSSRVVSKSAFNMIRPVPEKIYADILNSSPVYNSVNKYLVEKYESLSDIPILTPVFEFLNTDIKAPIPKDSTTNIFIGIYGRNSSTHVDPPSDNCALRILFNLGYADTYHLNPKYKVKDELIDTGLPEHFLYMDENSYVILGPVTQSKYKIYVDNDVMIKIPSQIPGQQGKTTIRPKLYKRITIIIDFIIADGLVQKLTEVAAGKFPNKSKKCKKIPLKTMN